MHLIKLCVGCPEPADLYVAIQRRVARAKKNAEGAHYIHRTRAFPRRARQLLPSGSLYWVMRGFVCARQSLLAIDTIHLQDEGTFCQLHLDPQLVLVEPLPRRPFQGWRYLEDRDAPPDIALFDPTQTPLPRAVAQTLDFFGLRSHAAAKPM